MIAQQHHTVRCPICHSDSSSKLLRAARQPAMLNRLYETHSAAIAAPAVDLEFRACDRCGFAWNTLFNPAAVNYSPGYDNDQSHSPAFGQHTASVVQRLASRIGALPGAILEVCCGKGDVLRALAACTGRVGLGFDPACDQPIRDSCIFIEPRVFDWADADALGREDALAGVCIRHVLEHLPNPKGMLALLAHAMRRSSDAQLYVEVPCFEWIARQATFFDLFNEHCSLFTQESLRLALQECGFCDICVSPCFGGQYLSATAKLGSFAKPKDDPRATAVVDHRAARERLEVARQEARALFTDVMPATALWGCGAKGVSLVNQLRLNLREVTCIVDLNPAKQGRFVPITGHPVVAPASLRNLETHDADAHRVVVMNSNYAGEIAAAMRMHGVRARLIVLEDALAHAIPG